MALDWNWFFSSLSQSAAAIVGIFGAFIITKIFSNQSVFVAKNTKLKELLVQAQRISDNANGFNVGWYNDNFDKPGYRDFPSALEEKFPMGENLDEVTEEFLENYIEKETFSKYSEVEGVKKKLRAIAADIFEANIKKRQEHEAAYKAHAEFLKGRESGLAGVGRTLSNMVMVTQVQPRTPFVSLNDIPWDLMRARNDDFNESYREAKHHSRVALEFLGSIKNDPESPSQISWALALVLCIFFIGVIYPLSFLPAAGAPQLGYSFSLIYQHVVSFKGFLLGLISTAFTIIVALFFNTHAKMKYSAADVQEIERLTDTKNYCAHFKFLN